jgi:hypothetical protein
LASGCWSGSLSVRGRHRLRLRRALDKVDLFHQALALLRQPRDSGSPALH